MYTYRRGREPYFIVIFFAFIITAFTFSVPVNAAAAAYTVPQTFKIELSFRGSRAVFTDKDFVIRTDDHLLMRELRRRGDCYAEKADIAARARHQGHSPRQIVNYILPLFDKKLDAFSHKVEKEPIPSQIFFNPHNAQFTITREAAGFVIDRDDLYARLLAMFILSPDVKLNVKTLPVYTDITAEYQKKGTNLKSSFSTDFSQSSAERKHNIALAASFWNGKRIEPGAEASFNAIVGRRTAERGFMMAKIILNGQFEDGIGGGVCQTSSTVYNAALIAGMEITAAMRHSLPVSYVPPSFDAAVSSAQDMRFKNTTQYPVFVRAWCTEERLYVQMYGEKNKYRIERRSENVSVIPYAKDETVTDVKGEYRDKVQYKGEKVRIRAAKNGLISKGYLRYYYGQKLVREELIRTDKYLPQNGLTVEGNLPPPPPPPPPVETAPEPGNKLSLDQLINKLFSR